MANKTYKLTFHLSDGTSQSVEFEAPQGEKGATGATGATGAAGAKGDKGDTGVGITDVTITEVS